jgi:lipid-binding SYLF domain-containing protein
MKRVWRFVSPAVLLLGLLPMSRALADPVRDAVATVGEFQQADPSIKHFFQQAAGYAVFPSVGKGGLIVGGAHGDGVLFEKGKAVGKTSLSQVTVGAQAGGQAYSQVIFFESPAAVEKFKSGNFAFSATASAVALKSGAAASAKYDNHVAVFTQAKGGLMLEASLGGQKFSYTPFLKPS